MQQGCAIWTQETRYAHDRPRQLAHPRILTTALISTMLLTGCLPDPKVGFDSPAPSKRLDAIVQASELEDDDSLVKLVEKLRSHTPAERMLAIRSLETRTGKTLDYHHAAPHWQRVAAYNRWVQYLQNLGMNLPDGMEPIEIPQDATPEGSGDETPMEEAQTQED